MTQKITLEGEWAYRREPTVKIRILCVDAAANCLPVVSERTDGWAHHHTAHGNSHLSGFVTGVGPLEDHDYDLVPLQQKPQEIWAIRRPDGWLSFHDTTKKQAENLAHVYACSGVVVAIVHFREVVE